MPSTDLPHAGRRLTARTRLKPPVEAKLSIGAESVDGWIVDQQDDGLGLRFGAEDAVRLLHETNAWIRGTCNLALLGAHAPAETLPVTVVHVTPRDETLHECLVGLVYDRVRMKPEQVLRLLETWQKFEPQGRR